jgi:hypothetical protein
LDRTLVGIIAVAEPEDLGGRQGRSADDMETGFDGVETVQARFRMDFTRHDLAAPTLTHIRVLCHQSPDPLAAFLVARKLCRLLVVWSLRSVAENW